jgi:hypothetical protein
MTIQANFRRIFKTNKRLLQKRNHYFEFGLDIKPFKAYDFMNLELTADVIYNYQKYRRVSGCRIQQQLLPLTLLKVLQNTTRKLITDLQLAQSTELTTSFQSILWLIICTKQMTWVGWV